VRIDRLTDWEYQRLNTAVEDQMPRTAVGEVVLDIVNSRLAGMTRRPDFDDYFLGIAEAVAARGECLRSRVGAILVRDRRILATGYNGTAPGEPSCLDGLCPRGRVPKGPEHLPYDSPEGHCIAIHAERNAWADAVRRGVDVEGATMYVTKEPCEGCAALLDKSGVAAVWRTQ
jgi:dCMP deaminase